MEPVIEPISREALKAELTPQTLLRTTNRAGIELYVVGPKAVNVIREIGRTFHRPSPAHTSPIPLFLSPYVAAAH